MNRIISRLHEPTTTLTTKAMNILNHHLLTASLSLVALTGLAEAGTINWGGAFNTTNYSADGSALQTGPSAGSLTGAVSYELGIFQNANGTEFIPGANNTGQWSDRWVPFETLAGSSATAKSLYNLGSSYFGNIAVMGTGNDKIPSVSSSAVGGTLVSGFQAYIWGFDTKTLGLESAEWFLVTGKDGVASGSSTNNWVVPDSNASGNDTFDVQWDIASASIAIVGQINNNKGGGEMVDPLDPFGTSDHQFATIPEPSSVVLSLLASLALLRRKR